MKWAFRVLVLFLLTYLLGFVFDFLNMADSSMVALGVLLVVGEVAFVIWYVSSWFTPSSTTEDNTSKKEV